MGQNKINTYEDIVVKNVKCGKYKKKRDVLNVIKYIGGNSINPEKKETSKIYWWLWCSIL